MRDGSGAPRFGILGPLVVLGETGPVPLRSRLQRLLLAVLLVEPDRAVSADRLIDELWGDELPDDPGGSLRTQVSRLRRALPDGELLVTEAGSYRLSVERGDIDAGRFEQLLTSAQHAADDEADRLVADALDLWRGGALEEFVDRPFAQIEGRRLEELRSAATERRAALLLAAGRAAEAASVADTLLVSEPQREGARALLMEALYRGGRHTDALAVYQSWRRQLAEEHGVEPSPALKELEQQILEHTVVGGDAPRRGLAARPSVRRPVSSFVGRDVDLRGVADLLCRERLVTLWGPGGVGKTRLALEVSARLADRYVGGVHLCDLTVLPPGGDVARALMSAIGGHERSGRRVDAQIVEHLGGQPALVVLDNCEHVLAGAAQVAGQLVQTTTGVDVLATSRQRLGIDGEWIWEVAPLAASGSDSDAVELFLDRARATNPAFRPTAAELGLVAAVCRRLDGLPLAIELAAARTRGLALEDLRPALERRLDVLTGGAGAPSRHRSLHAVIEWSYARLEPVEQRVFARLSVFRGAFDLDAAAAVAADEIDDGDAVVPAVLRLLDGALLVEQPTAGGRRYSMLDTVRDFGIDVLGDALDVVRERHAGWALAVAERAAGGLASPDEARWAAAIEQNIDELRAAHAWLAGHDTEGSLRLIAALRPYAHWRGQSEIFRWAEVAAAAAASSGSPMLPEVLLAAATGAWQRGDLVAASEAARAAKAAANPLGPAAQRAAQEARADVALCMGDLREAETLFTSAYALAREEGDLLQAVWDLGSAAVAIAYGGDRDRALGVVDEVLAVAELGGSPSARAFAHFVAGEILASEDPEAAEAHLRETIELAGPAGSWFVAGLAEVALAASRLRQQDIPTALAHCESVINAWYRARAWTPLWVTLRTVIALLLRVGAMQDAAVLYGAVASPRSGPPAFGADAAAMGRAAEQLRAALGDAEFERLVDDGRELAEDDVIQHALGAVARAERRPSRHAGV